MCHTDVSQIASCSRHDNATPHRALFAAIIFAQIPGSSASVARHVWATSNGCAVTSNTAMADGPGPAESPASHM